MDRNKKSSWAPALDPDKVAKFTPFGANVPAAAPAQPVPAQPAPSQTPSMGSVVRSLWFDSPVRVAPGASASPVLDPEKVKKFKPFGN